MPDGGATIGSYRLLSKRSRRSGIAAISLAILAAIGPLARAQSPEAEALFNEGIRLLDDHETARACEAFEASNHIESRAGTLILLGGCREDLGQLASAWSAYKDALNRVKDPRKRRAALEASAAIEARLSYLTVTVPESARLAGLTITRNGAPFDPVLWNRALPIDGGDYKLIGDAPRHQRWETRVQVPAERGQLVIEVPVLQEVAPVVPPPKPIAPAPPPRPPVQPDAPVVSGEPQVEGSFGLRRKLATGVAVVGVAGLIAAITLGDEAQAKQHEAFQICRDRATPCYRAPEADALIKAAHQQAVRANVGYGVAVAAAIGAGVLWLTGAPEPAPTRQVRVLPSVASGHAGVTATVAF